MRFIGFAGTSFSGINEAINKIQEYLEENKKKATIDSLANYIGGVYDINDSNDNFILCKVKTKREAMFLAHNNNDLLIIAANMTYFPAEEIVKLMTKEDHEISDIFDTYAASPNASVITGRGRDLIQGAIHAVRNKYIVG